MNINGGEIVLIAIIALVLFGPKRLPEVARQIGRAVAEVRKVSREFEREVRDAIEPIEREVRNAVEPIEREIRDAETVARQTYALDDDFSTFKATSEPPPPKPPSEE